MREKLQKIMSIGHIDEILYEGVLAPVTTVTLTLTETQRIIKERGYTGIKAALYTGYTELSKLLFMSARHFVALHDNFDTVQYENRIQRTKIIKAVVFSLGIISGLTVALLLLPAVGLIPVIVNTVISFLSVAFGVAFFGITFHALNNLIENAKFKVKPILFTLFTDTGLDIILRDYSDYRNRKEDVEKFEDDVRFLIDYKSKIELLFKKPEAYKDGELLKSKLQKLIEIYYFRAMEENRTDVKDLLSNLIYGLYNTIDSLPLQEILVLEFEKEGKVEINDEKNEMLKFFYTINAVFFRDNDNELNFPYRVNNQKRIMRLLLSSDRQSEIEEMRDKLHSDIQDTLYVNTYLENVNLVPEWYLSQNLDEQNRHRLDMALQSASNITYLFKDIYSFGITEQIGHMYIKVIKSKDVLQRIIESDIPVQYRLHALLRLAVLEENPFSVEAGFTRIMKSFGDFQEEKNVISHEVEKRIADESAKLLDSILQNKFLSNDNYLNSLETEMLFTAEAVILHEKYPDIDLIDFIKQLKYTFARETITDFIIRYRDTGEAERFRIPLRDSKEYIDSIKDMVEQMYKQNSGEAGSGNEKIKAISKAPLKLMETIKKSVSMLLVMLFFS